MAVLKQQSEQQQQQLHNEEENPFSFLLDELYCEEEELEDDEVLQGEGYGESCDGKKPSLFPLLLLEHDLFWDDEELLSLFSKEQQQQTYFSVPCVGTDTDSFLTVARSEAVEWVLKVKAHYGFTTLTAVLAINYLDRFICSSHFQGDKPWMIQLLAVTCLSLAAKVEETQVPLLLDLQVEETKYVFEAKAIQRMELLVLSTLQWKMHLITPISFLDHIIRRLGLKNSLHWEFLRRCECLLLAVVSDSRSVSYLPSVLATATMMQVIEQVEPLNPIDYKNQLLDVLKISNEKVNECHKLLLELPSANDNPRKRKFESIPGSPGGVIDTAVFSCDESSKDSWSSPSSSVLSSLSSSSSSSPLFKKSRVLSRVIVGSPS